MLVLLKTIRISIKSPIRLSVNISSTLHGFLMDKVSEEFASDMHAISLRPYSQNLGRINENKYIWTINTLNDYAFENFNNVFCGLKNIYLKHKDISLDIEDINILETSFDELFTENYFGKEKSKYIDLKFFTPTAFKSDGRYVNYPNLSMMIKSLINKYDYCSEKTSIYDENVIVHLFKSLEIIKYDLKSTYFYIEKAKIPSFVGTITIKVNGNQQLINFANMLFSFGRYSGVGIKNAIGMGAFEKFN